MVETGAFGESVGQLTGDFEHKTAGSSVRTRMQDGSVERLGQRYIHHPLNASTGTRTFWNSPRRWPAVMLSTIGSALALSAVGALCALLYPILKELRAERVKTEDGREGKLLGFWSIMVLSVIAGCICSSLCWILTYLDSYEPGMAAPTPLALARLRRLPGQSFHVGYGVAVLNGVMATLTVIWSLS